MRGSASDRDAGPSGAIAAKRPGVGAFRTELSAETRRLYEGDWARFAGFCRARGDMALPACPETVIAFLSQPGTGRAALRRRLAAIDGKHRLQGFSLPGADPGLRAALRPVHKAAPRTWRQPAPTAEQLRQLALSCPGDLAGRRDRALLLLAAAGLGRAALVGLEAERLRFTEAGVACGKELHVAPGVAASCPVRALEEWLRASATRYGPVFRKVNRWGQIETSALGTDAVRLILVRRRAAG